MTSYIVSRVLQALLVLILVSVIIFLMLRILPGDPILMYLTKEQKTAVSQEELIFLRQKFGLDRPLHIQYVDWLSHAARGDLGESLVFKTKVMDEVIRRVPITFHMGILAFIISLFIGIPLGIVAAVRRGGWLDNIITGVGNLGMTLPIFWVGILMMYFFGLKLQWLPIFGYTSPFQDFWLSTRQLVLPVFCLSIGVVAGDIRLMRSSMLEVMRQDYIRTAWAKGLKERMVIMRHALKNGLGPVITLKGMSIASILGGSVLIETVFNIPGMGRLATDALFSKDYPMVQGVILILAVVVLASNLLVDLSYVWLDPRVRYR
jgi:peptide/nickel transport system permease protein